MNSKCNLSVPLLLFRQLRSTILNSSMIQTNVQYANFPPTERPIN